MTTKHNISRAGEVFWGANHRGCANSNGRAGAPIGTLVQVILDAPIAGTATYLAAAQAVAAAGPLVLSANSLDFARLVTIVSAGNDSGITFTVTGLDIHNMPVAEVVTGANIGTATTTKAFKRVESVVASAAAAGNVSVGMADVFGLPYAVARPGDVVFVMADGVDELATSTLVVGDFTKPATGTTGDVRGTIEPATTPDGSVEFVIWQNANGYNAELLGGVDQYAG